jgi:sulfide:quinone oxidoreductase
MRPIVRDRASGQFCRAASLALGQVMAEVRRVTDTFAVAPQLELEDFAELKATGFQHIINNRPDGEAHDQPTSAEAEAAARAAGLTYVHAPFVGQPTPEAVEAAANTIRKTLAYCRSGTRSVTAWALSQAQNGRMTADEIVQAAALAGYNLSALKEALRRLGGR